MLKLFSTSGGQSEIFYRDFCLFRQVAKSGYPAECGSQPVRVNGRLQNEDGYYDEKYIADESTPSSEGNRCS